jgi:hypothetical protein
VYAVAPTMNPMYQYRESISLGYTSKSMEEVHMHCWCSGFS